MVTNRREGYEVIQRATINRPNLAGAPYANPVFTVGAENSVNVINVAVQFYQGDDTDAAVASIVAARAYLTTDTDGLPGSRNPFTAATSTIAAGTNGKWQPDDTVAGVAQGYLISSASGAADLNLTDTGAASVKLVLVRPDGRISKSAIITWS